MTDHITPSLLRYSSVRWRLGGSIHGGGESVFGESQTRRSDGGGRWFAELGSIQINTDAHAQLVEALLLDWNNGNDKVLLHRRAAPLIVGGGSLVPFSDGATFSDGSSLVSGQVNAEFAASAAKRATTLSVRVWGARAFMGGEPFTVIHPTMEDRLYGTARVLSSVADGEATVYSLRISPPLREAVTSGDQIDFNKPRCTMRLDMSGDEPWPTYEPGWLSRINLRFSETFRL